MSYLPSFILLKDAIQNRNYMGIVRYKEELQSLCRCAQLDLFTDILEKSNCDQMQDILLLVDTYCPDIEYDLMIVAINKKNKFLFKVLYENYGVMKL